MLRLLIVLIPSGLRSKVVSEPLRPCNQRCREVFAAFRWLGQLKGEVLRRQQRVHALPIACNATPGERQEEQETMLFAVASL